MLDNIRSISSSERSAILIGGIFIIVLILYLAIFSPLLSSAQAKQKILNDKHLTLNWMYQASAEYAQLRKSKPVKVKSYSKDSLLTIIDQTTVKLNVRSFIRRIDPDGDNQVQIWLERINFDDLIQLLNILKRNYNITVTSLSINRQSDLALVDARITVKGNS